MSEREALQTALLNLMSITASIRIAQEGIFSPDGWQYKHQEMAVVAFFTALDAYIDARVKAAITAERKASGTWEDLGDA